MRTTETQEEIHTYLNRPQVVPARDKADEAHNKWDQDSSAENRAAWRLALDELYQVCDQVKAKELEEQTQSIEEDFGAQQYGEAWRVVNEMSGRKKSKESQVSGDSPEERVATWFTHGEPPDVDDPDEEIPNIFEDLEINDEHFTLDEFRKVKSSLKLGKGGWT